MPQVVDVTDSNHFRDLISNNQYAIILFSKPWCPYCKEMYPILDRLAEAESFQDTQICKLNGEKVEDIYREMEIDGIPETCFFRDGIRIARLAGSCPQSVFQNWLRSCRTAERNTAIQDAHTLTIQSLQKSQPPVDDNLACAPQSQTTCVGVYQDRKKRPSLLPGARKAFSDPEPNCVFVPTPDVNGLQIGRANDGTSYFAISLWNSPAEDPGKIFFGLDFLPDPTENARFESAMFWVTFGHDGAHHAPLNIKELAPTSSEDLTSRRFFDADLDRSKDGLALVAEPDGDDHSTLEDSIIRGTTTEIRGQGVHSPTAVWHFLEDESKSVRQGLDGHYTLSAVLPTTSRVWMKFYAKAVLVQGDKLRLPLRHKMTLKIGSSEVPYERILDLSAALGSVPG